MNVFLLNVGIVKETEKAYLIAVKNGHEKSAKWIPKSAIYITNQRDNLGMYLEWKCQPYNSIEGDMVATKKFYDKTCDIEIKGSFYLKNWMMVG